MRWLFLLMSVNEDHQVQNGCKKMLLEILHYQLMDGQQKWAPRLVDILSVLHNYGAALESLIPCNSSTLEIIRGKLVKEPGHIHQPGAGNIGMKTENLILVLQILAQCLNGPSGRYSPNDLSLLCVALCKASLDTSIKHFCAKGAFQNCITMVIRQYLDADWLKERLKLTRMLVGITDHHHNNAHIAELLPPGARGMFIQRGFCYLVLSEILLDRTNVSDELLNSIKIKDMEKFIPKLKDVLEIDSYKLSSVVTLIDKCVGVNMTLNSEERGQLKCLLEKVRCVRVRDNVSMLDRTRVKDMIVRMTSKWALDIQTMKGKQTKIFEYASPVKMHVEQVQATQSSGEDDEQSDSDDDLPCKIQKISPQINT
ncbi:SMC5-SMC6 complex localization factor protein 2-like [Ruditapes philippinarum]|uniref:SMC5-SMC6 complex localization factor protein 2-like n=1 Tax=Ruditapes philippinarum TaxID=129788 RepID=UPI00295AB361|nr:SMC5-SMC6 complex localization factor protein 2-like [Ruditapes philippinarum]